MARWAILKSVARDRKKPESSQACADCVNMSAVERREAASSSSEGARVANGAKQKVRLAALRLPSIDRGEEKDGAPGAAKNGAAQRWLSSGGPS